MQVHRLRLLALLLPPLFHLSPPVHAQDDGPERQARYMMLNQHVCPGDGYSGMMELIETQVGPILTELSDEGMIDEWGILTHDWGDEYNVNFYMIAEDHDAWHGAWGEMVNRMNERHGGWFDNAMEHCMMHKDNLYFLYRYE